MPPLVSKSVLLIGGNQTVRRVLTDLASSHQLHLEMAPDGPACLARIEGTAYDLVLTDAETTGADDVELLIRMHQIRPSGSGHSHLE